MKASRTGIVLSALPGLLLLALFYSLALHMHGSLGAWPTSIGDRGFPPLLLAHESVAGVLFGALLLFTCFIAPVALLVCGVVQRWRACVPYVAVCALVFLVYWGLMQLAPGPFLYWWRD
jgi:hypothetical protein